LEIKKLHLLALRVELLLADHSSSLSLRTAQAERGAGLPLNSPNPQGASPATHDLGACPRPLLLLPLACALQKTSA